jgi:ubiquinone/menaquinone biosynthesis C-methylase UbiE
MEFKNRVCPVEYSGGLDNGIRKWLQNPRKILKPYVEEGMTAIDLGCGPGFFTVEMAALVGKSGQVIACDLQDGMLDKLKAKIKGSQIESVIAFHKCQENQIGLKTAGDFLLAFYMIHELPDQAKYFREIYSLLKPNGKALIVEPPFHVSKKEFYETINIAKSAGFMLVDEPKVFFGRAAVLKRV